MERGILLCMANDPYNFGHLPYTSALRGTGYNVAIANYDQAFSFNFDTVLAVILDSDSESYGAKTLAAHIKQWFPRVSSWWRNANPSFVMASFSSMAQSSKTLYAGTFFPNCGE